MGTPYNVVFLPHINLFDIIETIQILPKIHLSLICRYQVKNPLKAPTGYIQPTGDAEKILGQYQWRTPFSNRGASAKYEGTRPEKTDWYTQLWMMSLQ